MGYKDSKQVAGSSVAQQECHEEVCKKTPPSMATGACSYYKNRHENYIQRHQHDSKSGGDNPPSYYLDYGFKYCTAFKEETYEELSGKGKVWLNRTLKLLQEYMELGVVDKTYLATVNKAYNKRHDLPKNITKFYTGIECRNDDFRDFAFATHPDAYNPKVMQTLPCSDLILIANTPAYKEWLSGATWEQAIIMGKHMNITDIMLGCLDESSSYLADKIQDIFEDLAEKFTRW